MKRTMSYAQSRGNAVCRLPSGERLELPVILKHPTPDALANVARKYTDLALSRSAWPILRQFPHRWLLQRLDGAPMPAARREALRFLLEGGVS